MPRSFFGRWPHKLLVMHGTAAGKTLQQRFDKVSPWLGSHLANTNQKVSAQLTSRTTIIYLLTSFQESWYESWQAKLRIEWSPFCKPSHTSEGVTTLARVTSWVSHRTVLDRKSARNCLCYCRWEKLCKKLHACCTTWNIADKVPWKKIGWSLVTTLPTW